MLRTGQRRHRRYEVQDVHGSLLFRTVVRVRNLSVAGLALESTDRLQLGRAYSIRLAGDRDAVDLHGTIRWCHLASARPAAGGQARAVYEAGLAFDDVLTERGRSFLAFLGQHVVLAPHQRLTGRFRAEPLLPAELLSRYEFEVLKVSLSGMLVKTPLETSVGACFDLEIRLRAGVVPMEGRVAFVERDEAEKGAVMTRLGLEFVGGDDSAHQALADFIAGELERGAGDGAGSPAPAAD